MTQMHVAALQQSFSDDIDTNIDRVEALVRQAAGQGAWSSPLPCAISPQRPSGPK